MKKTSPQKTQNKAKARSNRRRSRGRRTGSAQHAGSQYGFEAPSAEGFIVNPSAFKMGGKAQELTDFATGMHDGMRIVGSDIFGTSIGTDGTHATGWSSSSPYMGLTPHAVSSRLTAFENLFQFYAFRYIRITYMPSVGSTTPGALALAIEQNSEVSNEFFNPGTNDTIQLVMQIDPCILTPVWQQAQFCYEHKGTKTWSTQFTADNTHLESVQSGLLAVTSSVLSPGTPATFGQLKIDYVCDFYKPQPQNTSAPSVQRRLYRQSVLGTSSTPYVTPYPPVLGAEHRTRHEPEEEKEDENFLTKAFKQLWDNKHLLAPLLLAARQPDPTSLEDDSDSVQTNETLVQGPVLPPVQRIVSKQSPRMVSYN